MTLQEFLAESQRRGARTLRDHLILSGYGSDYNAFRSMMYRVQRLIKPGGAHNSLLGTIFFPSRSARGRAPTWADDTPPMDDQEPMPDFTESPELSQAMEVQVRNDFQSIMTQSALQDAARIMARQPRGVQLAHSASIVALAHERELERVQKHLLSEQLIETKENLAESRKNADFLRSLVKRNGTDLA